MSNNNEKLVFGSDPEVFAAYELDGKLFVLPPAEFRENGLSFVPDKDHPSFYKEDGIEIMEDGVAFEYTLKPSTDWKELFSRIQSANKLLKEKILSKFTNICDGEVHVLPTIDYEISRWDKKSNSFQKCLIFGCDSDYNAFDGGSRSRVIDALKHPKRYGGGHIHISGSSKFKEDVLYAVQCLAIGIGLAAVAFSNVPDLDKDRTFLYGKPGKFRPQRYANLFDNIPFTDFGIEYRTPSNAWTNSSSHAEKIFKWAEISVRNLFEGNLGKEILHKFSNDIQKAIVDCDQPLAREILSIVEAKI